jgi:hypothetical protein
MRKMIGLEFRKNAAERDAKKIEDLKVRPATKPSPKCNRCKLAC